MIRGVQKNILNVFLSFDVISFEQTKTLGLSEAYLGRPEIYIMVCEDQKC